LWPRVRDDPCLQPTPTEGDQQRLRRAQHLVRRAPRVVLDVDEAVRIGHAELSQQLAIGAVRYVTAYELLVTGREPGLITPKRPGVGGFLNASFGNAPELIIALLAVADNLPGVVRGSLTGSVVSNILLVLGAAMIAGGDGKVDARSLRWQLAAVFGAVLLLL